MEKPIQILESVTVNELANALDIKVTQIIAAYMQLGMFVSINMRLNKGMIETVLEELNLNLDIEIQSDPNAPKDEAFATKPLEALISYRPSTIEELKDEIKSLLKVRLAIINKSDGDDPRVDNIRDEIVDAVWERYDEFEPDYILELYTEFGGAPTLGYDDNGRWAVSGDSFGGFSTGAKTDMEQTTFFTKNMWFYSIKKAVRYFFKQTYNKK